MSSQNIYAEVIEVSPAMAESIIDQNFETKNRPLNDLTVDYYADQMSRGLWKLNGEGIQFTASQKLVNGQHRLQAVVKAGIPIRFLFVHNVPEDSFTTYDQQRTRTTADLFHLEGIKNATNKAAMINKYLKMVKQGSDYKSSLKKNRIAKVEILDEYKSDKEQYDFIYEKAEKCYLKWRLLTTSEISGYMAFLIKEKKHDSKNVISFFLQLFDIERAKHDAIIMLRDRLIRELQSYRKLQPRVRYTFVVKAWNAYITNKDLKVLYYDEEKEGTIYFT